MICMFKDKPCVYCSGGQHFVELKNYEEERKNRECCFPCEPTEE
ncbi:MAG: hypothetical protein VB038_04325 [Methanobrevibacter sp.]|nr:hypothetical protein [Methanobrevibacter sp.]MEA4956932.1 hypothetical protein [Methanobrevibacter sp.]